MAAALAAIDFKQELERRKQQLKICLTRGNNAIDRSNKQVFKSFFWTERRDVNLDLIHEHVDRNAQEIELGDEGSYVQMKNVGSALPDVVDVGAFIGVANSLAKAHETGFCHGDIRIDNMMLESGTLIDWDLAEEVNEHVYPEGLRELVDGERHPDVMAAIKNGSIGDHDSLSLKKAFEFFKAQDSSHQKSWEDLISNIETAAEREKARAPYKLVLKDQSKIHYWMETPK